MISLIFIFLAAICNAAMDKVSFHFGTSIFANFGKKRYFNPDYSWSNKWKTSGKEGLLILVGEERFFLSSTVLVFLTDFWHLMKQLMIIFISLAVAFGGDLMLFGWYAGWWMPLIYLIIFQGTFTVFFDWVFKRR